MSQSTVAKRYTQALFETAKDANIVNEVSADLAEFSKVLAGTPELLTLLSAPKVSVERKKQMISELFAGAQPAVINVLALLVERKRFNEVTDVVVEFDRLADDAKGVAKATVFSTRALTDEEHAEISAAFAKRVNKDSLIIDNVIDESLIGGIRVQIGNDIFDSSVKGKLARLENTLIG
ncbi:F0F1 ATP synthase subunit delta [Caryophanon tenue]|uniref:ATP synthase subunit delta n=1 Tax=Caryophanon tenue TaxID=33978 RepID=A0A1C0Y818_9BACL|nr:F0F1 ATP synthase subunit delta [Caryophanon tenue]OCS83312.1 F0F1 ATP synthase subunit delta [Caryophanon tenue]